MADIGDWFKTLPPLTRYWFGGTVALSLVARFGIISPFYLILQYQEIFSNYQIFQPNLIVNLVDAANKDPSSYASHMPFTTHHIGRSNYPLTTPRNSAVFVAHYSLHTKQPFSGPVKKLTFHQLGSSEAPNVSPYSSTCEIIEFNGHIHKPSTPFEVVSQLPKVTKINFFIGPAQQFAFNSDYSDLNKKIPVCPSVKCLKVVMDLEYFHSFQPGYISHYHSSNGENYLTDTQHSLVSHVDALLKHAGDVFPNLKSLIVDLPENEKLFNSVRSLIQFSHGLRRKTQTTLKNITLREKCAEEYSMEGIEQPFNGISWNPAMESEKQLMFNEQFLPSYATPNELYVDDSVSETDMISPMSDTLSPSFPQLPQMLYHHRSPPGFEPLSIHHSGSFAHESFTHERVEQSEMNQVQHAWLNGSQG